MLTPNQGFSTKVFQSGKQKRRSVSWEKAISTKSKIHLLRNKFEKVLKTSPPSAYTAHKWD